MTYINTSSEIEYCNWCSAPIFPASAHHCIGYPTNDYELVIVCSKRLERYLRTVYNAKGNSLRKLLRSIENILDNQHKSAIEYIIDARNKLVHNELCVKLDNRNLFIYNYHYVTN